MSGGVARVSVGEQRVECIGRASTPQLGDESTIAQLTADAGKRFQMLHAGIRRGQQQENQIDRTLVNERLLATLASGFAALAILLALLGVYGVTSFLVTRRTREIGIRVALGATRAAAAWVLLRDTMIMLAAGIAVALPIVWLVGRLIESQLFGVRPMDWGTVIAAAAAVALGALAASALPARRATSINPIEALRHE